MVDSDSLVSSIDQNLLYRSALRTFAHCENGVADPCRCHGQVSPLFSMEIS